MKNKKRSRRTALQQQIEKKIEALKAIEHHLPLMVIVHDIRDLSVVHMSPSALKHLKVSMEEIRHMGAAYHSRFFNPEEASEYVPKILGMLEKNNDDEMVSFFQQVRASEKEDWGWYLSSSKIFIRDENDKPLLTITTAIPVDPNHHLTKKVERLLQENNFLRRHKHIFASLTKREKTILKLMAMGLNSSQMAKKLHISETTASTHRRNIKAKLKAQNFYDITKFAQSFDLI